MLISHTIWSEVAAQLAEIYRKRYFTDEFTDGENPMSLLTVGEIPFFGTKPITLCIIGKPYGWRRNPDTDEWEEHWPPPGFEDAKAQHILAYPKFAKYKTYIWTDFIIVQKIMDRNPDSRIEEMMNALHDHLVELGSELADYGITYVGKIESGVEASYFTPYIEEFLVPPEN